MAIFLCDALRHYIFTILQSSTRRISSLELWRMTDRQRRENHYGTSHQVRKILKYRRILSIEEKPSYSWTFWLNWWYAPSRWFLRRKNISQREENVLGRIYPQLHIRSQKWNEKWRKKWKPFFFPVKKKTFYEIKNIADFVHFLSRRPTRKKKHSV